MSVRFSELASSIETETAFDVLAVAKRLKAAGKDVIELEIGDSPFPSSPSAVRAGIAAIEDDHCHYAPSSGLPEFRSAASDYVNQLYGLNTTSQNVVAGPGAKIFEQLFLEAFLNPGQGVLIFSPHFPTYPPNVARRGGHICFSELKQATEFRPNLDDIERFINSDQNPKAIFLNSPHNPTGGVASREDLAGIADLIRGKNVAVFSDEPYDRMVWRGRHHSLLEFPGMMDQCVSAYTFSKTFSMSGWRLGFAVSSPSIIEIIGKLINTTLSCIPPFSQRAGIEAMKNDLAICDQRMQEIQRKVELLAEGANQIEGVKCLVPTGSFYVFPSVAQICNRLGITSHGLAMFLLEGADDSRGVACLGGECFGQAGAGFLRFSCAEPDDRLRTALEFFADSIQRTDRVERFLETHAKYRLDGSYSG